MKRAVYSDIAARLSTKPTFLGAFGTIGLWLSTIGGGVVLLQLSGAFWLLGQLLLGISFFQAFAIVHECGHGSFSTSKPLNVAVGHLASALCAQPFYSWKYIHQEHHVWAGHETRDPVVEKRNIWRKTGRVPWLARIAWRSWIPVIAALQHLVYWSYPFKLMKSNNPEVRRRWRACAISAGVMFAIQVGLASCTAASSLRLNIILAVLVYLFLAELVNLPHHTDQPSVETKLPFREQWRVTRSCYYPVGLSEFCVMNFNFHIEHHLFPTLPWYQLKKARRLVRAALQSEYVESRGIGWNVAWRMQPLTRVVRGTSSPKPIGGSA